MFPLRNGKLVRIEDEDVPLRTHTHEPKPSQKPHGGCSCSSLSVFGGGDWLTCGTDVDAGDFIWLDPHKPSCSTG